MADENDCDMNPPRPKRSRLEADMAQRALRDNSNVIHPISRENPAKPKSIDEAGDAVVRTEDLSEEEVEDLIGEGNNLAEDASDHEEDDSEAGHEDSEYSDDEDVDPPPVDGVDVEEVHLAEEGVHEQGNADIQPDQEANNATPGQKKSVQAPVTEGRLHRSNSDNFSLSASFEYKEVSHDNYFSIRKGVKNVYSGPDRFAALSDEIIISVFKWLPKATLCKCAMVCKRFWILMSDEVFWRRVDFGMKTLPPGKIGQILARGTLVLRAARSNITSPVLETNFGFVFPQSKVSRLQFLDLSTASIALADLESLMAVCKELRKLSLENVPVSDGAMELLSANKRLHTLHLGMATGVTACGLKSLLKGCQDIKELNLAWTSLSEEALDVVCSHLTHSVERLNISGCRDTLSNKHVERIVTSCPLLQELDVSDAINLTSEALEMIILHLNRLESLSSSRTYNIAPSTYLGLISARSLRYLNVFGVMKEAGLAELRRRLPRVDINVFPFSSIARPTVGVKRTSIWGLRVRD